MTGLAHPPQSPNWQVTQFGLKPTMRISHLAIRESAEETVVGVKDALCGSPQGDPPGHLMTVDHKGNVYAVQAELSGADGHSGGAGAYKFTFKGYSPKVSCPPCGSTKRIE